MIKARAEKVKRSARRLIERKDESEEKHKNIFVENINEFNSIT